MRSSAVEKSSPGARHSSMDWMAASESDTDFLTFNWSRGKGFRPAPALLPPCVIGSSSLAIEPGDCAVRLNFAAELLCDLGRIANAVGLCVAGVACPLAVNEPLCALADLRHADHLRAVGDDELAHWFRPFFATCFP